MDIKLYDSNNNQMNSGKPLCSIAYAAAPPSTAASAMKINLYYEYDINANKLNFYLNYSMSVIRAGLTDSCVLNIKVNGEQIINTTLYANINENYNTTTKIFSCDYDGSLDSLSFTGTYDTYILNKTYHLNPLANAHFKVSDIWKKAFAWLKVLGVWKRCVVWKKINGVWKRGK